MRVQTIDTTKTWRPLSFYNKGDGTPMIDFEAETSSSLAIRTVFLLFSGDDVPEGTRYIGSAAFGGNGTLIVHAYVT
jgi:hypothetical protein